MSAAVGGPLEEITIDGRRFPVVADADGERDLGGFTNEVNPNGDGSARILKTRKAWSFGGIVVEMNNNRGDQQFLQERANAKEFYPITFTHADGSVFAAPGIITGDIKASTMKASCPLTFSGPKTLEAQ